MKTYSFLRSKQTSVNIRKYRFAISTLILFVIFITSCSLPPNSGYQTVYLGGSSPPSNYVKKNPAVDVYHDEDGQVISRWKFSRKHRIARNLEGYYEEDGSNHAILVPRQNVDSLDYPKFINELSSSIGMKIEQDLPLLIFYFREIQSSEASLKYYYQRTQQWAKDDPAFRYLVVLHKEYDHEFVNTINLEAYDLLVDKDDVMSVYITPYGVADNHSFLIKQDGQYKYYIGEGGMHEVKQDWGIGW